MKFRSIILYVILSMLCLSLFLANIVFGSVSIPLESIWAALFSDSASNDPFSVIILSSRLPQAFTALFAGAALAISGLMLQTIFSNPLADPSILGISSGSGMGVALVMMFFGGSISSFGLYGYLAVVLGSFIGAILILGIIILFSMKIKSNVMLLVIGIMVGYIANSVITLMSFYAESDGIVQFVIWGMGDFSGVSSRNITYFLSFISVGLLMAVLLIKPLNAMLLGDKYSQNLGVNITKVRIMVLLSTGLLTAIVTAFCGPIAFIGLAVPHIARLIFNTSNHQILIPTTIIIGSIIALICNLFTVIFTQGTVIPLNVITPLMGAPVIIYVIINKKKIAYFN